MEVKIKTKEGLIDATIEIVDDVMIVSPKEVKFVPKDGDVFCVGSLCPCIGIVTEAYSFGKPDKDRLYFSVGYWEQSGNMQLGTFCACNRNTEPNYRPATEEEKQKLFDKLKEEGYSWDAVKKELVKLKWKPLLGQIYHRPSLYAAEIKVVKIQWRDDEVDKGYYNKGWCFKTKEECQAFCDKLNEAVNSVKP